MPTKKKVVKTSTFPVEETMKIKVLKRDNPFREGTAVAKRVDAVLHAKSVAVALKKGARKSTVRWLKTHRQIALRA